MTFEHDHWRDRWDFGWRSPHSLSALIPASAHTTDELRDQIERREAAILSDLRSLGDLHALRIVVVPEDDPYGPRLLINSVSDAPSSEHRHRIARVLAPHLHDLLAGDPVDPEAFAELLRRHRTRERTLFHASPGVSLRQIRQEARLRQVLREWVRARRADGTLEQMSLEQARLAMRRHVLSLDDPTCARGPLPESEGAWRRRLDRLSMLACFPLLGVLGADVRDSVRQTRPGSDRLATACMMGLWWVYAAPFTALAFLGVRLMELIEPDYEPPPASDAKLDHIEAVEDSRTKNELTVWFPVKPTWAGRLLMAVTLYGSERGTRHLWTRGQLAGAQNIHFARLLLVDGGRRMVFMSDYEGSFDAYIDHFIGIGGNTRAVIPISSRVHGCPKTRWLYFPQDVLSFRRRWRAMARSYQLQASVRYVAYPDLSANDILNHQTIREGLFAEHMSSDEVQAWAERI